MSAPFIATLTAVMSALWTAYFYPAVLLVLSIGVALAEHLAPRRPAQRQLRPRLLSDLAHLVFNGHFLGVLLSGVAIYHVLPPIDRWLAQHGLITYVYAHTATRWPLWVQIPVALVVADFLQWCVHNLLHRVSILWQFHQVHHSVVDGEMDWIVSFRFHFMEVVIYKTLLYVPLSFFGFAPAALMFHAVLGTLIGHLNHANLDLGYGRWRYVLNSPRMHLWHHDFDADARTTVNFGIIFSVWDWLLGTARMPDAVPSQLGFRGVQQHPDFFLGHLASPLHRLLGPRTRTPVGQLVMGGLGLGVLALLWAAHRPAAQPAPSPARAGGERAASSQPAGKAPWLSRSSSTAAQLAALGSAARQLGFAHPEQLISVDELAAVLHDPQLVLLDVRPRSRYERGHIPTARQIDRADYSQSAPVPGLSKPREALEEVLRARGVRKSSVLVLYGDGGPEPYRLWWTLSQLHGQPARILDGGLQQWKHADLLIVEGSGEHAEPGQQIERGDVVLAAAGPERGQSWQDVQPLLSRPGTALLDVRTAEEYSGAVQHPDAARAGHIPGARHLGWQELFRGPDDHRLRPPASLRPLVAQLGIEVGAPVVMYCQSATRSAVLYFALLQLGTPADQLINYGGSWAEYSRLNLPVER